MQIIINGTQREVADNLSVSSLLGELRMDMDTTIVELNREVLQKGTHSDVMLSDGDSLELVRFVGGG